MNSRLSPFTSYQKMDLVDLGVSSTRTGLIIKNLVYIKNVQYSSVGIGGGLFLFRPMFGPI